MVTSDDVNPSELIEQVAEELKHVKEIVPPEWAPYVKTGVHKERPPVRQDWWYVRSAAVLRSVWHLGPIGVSKLRTKFGGRKNRGDAPDRTYKGSGNIIRKVLQQLQKGGLIKEGKVGAHKGRIVTPAGEALLDRAAFAIAQTKPVKKAVEHKEETPAEKPKEAPKKEKKAAAKKPEAPEAHHDPVEKKEAPAKEQKVEPAQ
jgi:small subunit ribosomal protein S19e